MQSVFCLDINAHNDQICTEIEPTLLFSKEGQKQSAFSIRSGKQFSMQNNGKYIDKRSNEVTTAQAIMKEL